jgi:hypothetical protein
MFGNFLKAKTNAQKLKAVVNVISRIGGGVHKRIDENRELLELLQSKCPVEFMDEHFYVEGWLHNQDDFFTCIADAVQEPNLLDNCRGLLSPYQRAWPGIWQAKKPSCEKLDSPNIGSAPTSSDAKLPASEVGEQPASKSQKTGFLGKDWLIWLRCLVGILGLAMLIRLVMELSDIYKQKPIPT